MFRILVRMTLLVSVVLMCGCGTRQVMAPVISVYSKHNINHDVYIVRKGDTLSSIAWGLSIETQHLIQWNHLKPPYKLEPGMRLHLISSDGRADSAANVGRILVVRSHRSERVNVNQDKQLSSVKLSWRWPARGSDVRFYKTQSGQVEGVDIRGQYSSSIVAAAEGRVVYSGTRMQGYGSLIIVKHDSGFLSVYEFNSPSLVKVGQHVSAGELLARMGGDRRLGVPELHFEIRQHGVMMNPLNYLPDHA